MKASPQAEAPTFVVVSPADLERIVRAAVRAELDAARAEPANDRPAGEWIDARAASALLGVTARCVARMAAPSKGRPARLASARVGRLLRFLRADVLAVLERRDG